MNGLGKLDLLNAAVAAIALRCLGKKRCSWLGHIGGVSALIEPGDIDDPRTAAAIQGMTAVAFVGPSLTRTASSHVSPASGETHR